MTAEADALTVELPKLDQEAAAIRDTAGLETYRAGRVAELHAGEARLTSLRVQEVELRTAIARGRDRLADLAAGRLDDPRIHLHHASEPEPPAVPSRRAFGEAWAALSVGLLIAALAVIVWFRILPAPAAIVVLLGSYLAIESFFDRNIGELVLKVTVVLADHLVADPRRGLYPRAVPGGPAGARASCSSPTTSASCGAGSADRTAASPPVRRCAVMRRSDGARRPDPPPIRPRPAPRPPRGDPWAPRPLPAR